MAYFFISQIGCLLPLLILANLVFGWLIFPPLTWLAIGGVLLLLFIFNSYILVRRAKSSARKQRDAIDIEAEVIEK